MTKRTWAGLALAVLAASQVSCSRPEQPTPVILASPTPAPPSCSVVVNGDNNNVQGCGNVTNPAPSPSPSAGTGSGVSDVKGFGQFFYGTAQIAGKPTCPVLNEAEKHKDAGADFTLAAGCEGAITCTPFSDLDENKDGKPDNAKDPSRNVKWSSAGPVSLATKGEEVVFNRFVTATGTGIATIQCDFVDSAGKLWTKSATYSVHGS